MIALILAWQLLWSGSGPHSDIDVSAFRSVGDPEIVFIRITIKLESGWHTYWKNPGDSGLPPTLQWELPSGWQAGEIQYPPPVVFKTPDEVTFGYADSVQLIIPLFPSANQADSVAVGARFRWLVCKEECIPGRVFFRLKGRMRDLPVQAGDLVPPEPLAGTWTLNGDSIAISLGVNQLQASQFWFFPDTNGQVETSGNVIVPVQAVLKWNLRPFSTVKPIEAQISGYLTWLENGQRTGRQIVLTRTE